MASRKRERDCDRDRDRDRDRWGSGPSFATGAGGTPKRRRRRSVSGVRLREAMNEDQRARFTDTLVRVVGISGSRGVRIRVSDIARRFRHDHGMAWRSKHGLDENTTVPQALSLTSLRYALDEHGTWIVFQPAKPKGAPVPPRSAPRPARPAAPAAAAGWITFATDKVTGKVTVTRVPDARQPQVTAAVHASMAAEWASKHNADLERLLVVLPERVAAFARASTAPSTGLALVDVVLDVGRPPALTVRDAGAGKTALRMPAQDAATEADVRHVASGVSMGNKNRACIPGTLHRVSVIRSADGARAVGVTVRVGRWFNSAEMLAPDLAGGDKSLLLVGAPGAGKTSALRDISRLMAGGGSTSVVVVDTSNEIAGGDDAPHRSVGRARRMQVPAAAETGATMVEAVQNHSADVVVVDEVGTRRDAEAVVSVSRRGVRVVATAHGNVLGDVLSGELSGMVGGTRAVIQSTQQARERGEGQAKTERAGRPAFDACVEMETATRWSVVTDVAAAVDRILAGRPYPVEVRTLVRDSSGALRVRFSKEVRQRRPHL